MAGLNSNFNEQDIRKVVKGAGTTLVGSSIGKGLFFLTQILIARLLGVEAFGLYSLGFAVIRIAELISRLGLSMGGMRFISVYKNTDQSRLKGVIILSISISFLSAIVIGGTLYFLSEFIARTIFHKPELAGALGAFSISVPFIAGMTVISSLFQGFHTTKYTVYVRDFVQPVSNMVLIFLFYFNGLGLKGVIYAFTLSHLVAFITGFPFLRKLFPQFLRRDIKPAYEFKNLISYSIPLLFVGFLHYFLSWTDTLMLGFLGSTQDVGIYRAASQVPFLMTFFLFASNSIYSPLAADIYANGEMQRLTKLFQTTTRWIVYATVPIFIYLIFTAKEVMIFFGKDYVEIGSLVLITFSVGQLVNCIVGGAGFTLTMTGKQNVELINSISLVILNIALNWWLIPEYGAIGAAISSSASAIIINVARCLEIFSLYRISPYTKPILKMFFPTIICVVILLILRDSFFSNVKLLVNMFLTVSIFLTSIYFLMLAEEDRYLINIFKNKLSRKALL